MRAVISGWWRWAAWPRTGDQAEGGRGHAARQPGSVGHEARVVLSSHHQRRYGEEPESVPQRGLGAGARQAQARGQAAPACCAGVQPGRPRRAAGRRTSGCGQPALEEAGQVAAGLQLRGHRLVAGAAAGGGVGVFDAPGRTDDGQAGHLPGLCQSGVEREPGSQRVSEQVKARPVQRLAGRLDEVMGPVDKVGLDVAGSAVAGQVHQHEVMGPTEAVAEGSPEAPGLREPVGQHDRRCPPISDALPVQDTHRR